MNGGPIELSDGDLEQVTGGKINHARSGAEILWNQAEDQIAAVLQRSQDATDYQLLLPKNSEAAKTLSAFLSETFEGKMYAMTLGSDGYTKHELKLIQGMMLQTDAETNAKRK